MVDGVANITTKGDAIAELDLDPRSADFLEKLVACGGEGRWDWDNPKMPQSMREMVADLIIAAIVVEREHVTHAAQVIPDYLTVKITERGRNVLATYQARTFKVGKIESLPA